MSGYTVLFERRDAVTGYLKMSEQELRRKSIFDGIKVGRVTRKEAAELLDITYDHCRKAYKRYVIQGDESLVHGNRGQPSNRAKPADFRREVLERYKERYADYGPTLASEKFELDGCKVDHETLRRWLISDGQWRKRRKKSRHRTRRARKEHFGELVQMDGSHHAWFGPDRPKACLMNMVDDATGTTLSMLAEEETTAAAMLLLWRWIEQYGIPKALYTDKKSVFVTDRKPTIEEELAGEQPLTAFGKACSKLDIKLIKAHSPQAKGRVERNHGVYQDRFVKELALQNIDTIEEANKLLAQEFCPFLNDKYAESAVKPQDFHRPVPKRLSLADVFSTEKNRSVTNDWTIRLENQFYQIKKARKRALPKPKDEVQVRTRLDGTMQILYRNKPVDFELVGDLSKLKAKQIGGKVAPVPKRVWTPPADHPWRRSYTFNLNRAKVSR